MGGAVAAVDPAFETSTPALPKQAPISRTRVVVGPTCVEPLPGADAVPCSLVITHLPPVLVIWKVAIGVPLSLATPLAVLSWVRTSVILICLMIGPYSEAAIFMPCSQGMPWTICCCACGESCAQAVAPSPLATAWRNVLIVVSGDEVVPPHPASASATSAAIGNAVVRTRMITFFRIGLHSHV